MLNFKIDCDLHVAPHFDLDTGPLKMVSSRLDGLELELESSVFTSNSTILTLN